MRIRPEQNEASTPKKPFHPSGLRRSQRVILDVPLVVHGIAEDKRPFREETFTLTISAHGGLVVLQNQVALGQKVLLLNPKTHDEREGTVAFLGPPYAGLSTVAVQFIQPAPDFWAIQAPPPDWDAAS